MRLSEMDAQGRLRLDAAARYLQDVAGDDVAETGWGAGEHVWVVRRTRIDVVAPFSGDESIDLATWCSGVGASAAARRTSLAGDGGGVIEAESVWIHLDAAGRPARLAGGFFDLYAEAAGGRRVSTRLALPEPPAEADRRRWPLRATDVDVLGHVNNAAYWEAVEEVLAGEGAEGSGGLTAVLEFRRPLDLGDRVELLRASHDRGILVALVVGESVRATGWLGVPTTRE